MRKIAIGILTVFFLLSLVALAVQSPWGKQKAISMLTEAMKNQGITVEIDEIQGALPHKLLLKGVKLSSHSWALSFATLEIRLSLLRLLQKKIVFSLIQGDQVKWEKTRDEITMANTPFTFPLNIEKFQFTNVAISHLFSANLEGFLRMGKKKGIIQGILSPKLPPFLFSDWLEKPWNFSSQFTRNEDLSWILSKINAKNDFFQFQGQGALDSSGRLAEMGFQIQSSYLQYQNFLTGRLFANLNLKQEGESILTQLTWRIPHLRLGEYLVNEVAGNVLGQFEKKAIKGNATFTGEYLNEKWEAKTDFDWAKGSSLNFSSYQVHADAIEFKGNLELRPDNILIGITEFNADQIHPLASSLYGKAVGKVIWFPIDQNEIPIQAAELNIKASDFYWNTFSAQEISLYADIIDPLRIYGGTVNLNLEKGKWKTLTMNSANLETTIQGENWPFTARIDGEWKHPLTLQFDGYWRYKKTPELLVSLQNGYGSFYNQPWTIPSPINVEWSPTLFRLSDTTLQFADGSFFVHVDREKDNTDAHVTAKHLPLDFLSLNPLDITIRGYFDLDAQVSEKADQLEGHFKASLEHMEVETQDPRDPLGASGSFEGVFKRNQLNLTGALTVRESPLLKLDLSLPVHLEIWPFKADLLLNQKAQGHLKLQGRIEDFLDFADLGSHRLEGECNCDLTFYNTLAHPLLEGYCELENGYYQNYITGTELKNIRAEWLAEKNRFYLRTLTAQDLPEKGSLSASGEIQMDAKDHFPYRFEITVSRFSFLTLDLVTAEAEGKILLTGNWQHGLAKGNIQILTTDVTIPNRIPRQLPDLQVTYKNASKPPEPPQPRTQEPYPLSFDLNVDAPDGIFITGRGLNSEWKGKFHIGGEQTAIKTKGQIELIKGEFVFSGRRFKLSDGVLIFSGIENEMPFLNLAGTMEVKNISIVARMKGLLNNPQITFQSTPPLPMGTILSYLLFGQEMSEINSLQALQLANSLATLAGEGPDVLENTRRSLGVDRLQIISVPSEVEGEDTIAVQVGKYVTEDVLVSISQGAEDPSTNITIEVELKNGFSLVLESQAMQEQGKFTLRWTKTY